MALVGVQEGYIDGKRQETAELRQATQKRVCKVKDKTTEVHTHTLSPLRPPCSMF